MSIAIVELINMLGETLNSFQKIRDELYLRM